MAKKVTRNPPPPAPRRLRPTFIRQWREHRDLSLEEVAERVGEITGEGFTHASLSRIERGRQPYSQPVLEALASVLQTDTASLLARSPDDGAGLWNLWNVAKAADRQKILDIARTIIGKTETD